MRILPALRSERRTADLSGFDDPYRTGQIPPNSYAGPSGSWSITPDSAMRLAAVWACVRTLSDVVAELPVDNYRTVDGLAVPAGNKPKLLIEPMPDQGFEEWIHQDMVSALLDGNSYGVITQLDRGGWPSEVLIQNPADVQVIESPTGLRYRIGRQRVEYDAETIMHFRGRRMPGAALGMSPIAYAAATIGIGLSTVKFGADWFRDGAHPSSMLTSDQVITDEQASTLKRRLLERLREKREPVVLGAGLKLEQWQVSPNESQFLETIKANRTDIANIYGLPAEWIGGDTSSSMTYSNREQRGLDFLAYTLDYWLTRWEKFLSRMMPPPEYVKFNRAALLRTDATTRWQVINLRLRNGTLNADEARALEDEAPLPDGKGQLYLWPPQAPYAPTADGGLSLDEQVNSATALIRAGFDPEASLHAVGLDSIPHTGLVPVTVKPEEGP